QFEEPRIEAGLGEDVGNDVDEVRMAGLDRRYVDGDRHPAGRGPQARLPAGSAQHKGPDREDRAALLGEGNEMLRPHLAARRVAPADQRLGAGDGARQDVDLRLVDEAELAFAERLAEIAFELYPFGRALAEIGRVE